MKSSICKKVVLIALTGVFSIGLEIVVLNGDYNNTQKAPYIEVGGNKIVYVPRTAQYVKFDGQIRKIIRFASTLSEGEKDCKCPKCCNGYCYVIVYTDGVPGSNLILPLAILWVSCT